MTIATLKFSTSGVPPHRRWTGTEYLRLADLGFFDGQRVELIDGKIIQMSPIHNAHSAAVSRITKLFNSLSEEKYWVRTQATLELQDNYPEPDIAVVSGPISSEGTFPTSARFLVIEVSDSTLKFDQKEKMSLYAASNIPDYWIINLNARQIEVFRNPFADSTEPFGWALQVELRVIPSGKSVSPSSTPLSTSPSRM